MMTGDEKPAMTEQQREAFEALDQIEALAGWANSGEIEKWADVVRRALSHAEGEAQPAAVGYLSVLSDGTRIVDTRQQYDAPEVWPLYTHPAPRVAVPEGCVPVPRTLVERWANVDAFNAPKGAAMELKTIAQQMLSVPDDRDRAVAGEQANRCIGTINDLLDEREIAARALDHHVAHLRAMGERDARNNEYEGLQTWEDAVYFARQEAARLRAGKGDES